MKHGLAVLDTRRGRRLEVSREIAAPASTVWALLVDVTRWPAWGPAVTDVAYAGRSLSAGTTGRVQVLGLLWLPFAIEGVESWRWTWTVAGRTPPADGHRVDGIADDRCRASFELPLWAAPYLLVCWVALWSLARLAVAEPSADVDHAGEPRRR